MNTSDILLLYDYSCWANARILQATLRLTPEEFVALNTSSHGSLRGTLVHTLFAEIIWRRRLQGESMPAGLPVEAGFSTLAELQKACAANEAVMRTYLQSLTDVGLQAVCKYQNTKGVPFENVAWNILMQVLNHSTQHRAEAAVMLTDLGHSPGDVDMILYLREKGL